MEVGREGDYITVSLHCHHQKDSCIRMGSDESHFNVSVRSEMGSNENHLNFSVGSDEQSHKTVFTNHNFPREREPKLYRTEVLPLTSLPPYR